jgi:hypothetical protein
MARAFAQSHRLAHGSDLDTRGEEYQKLGIYYAGSVGIVKYNTNVGRGRCNKRQITKEPERMMTKKFLFNRVRAF